MQNNVKNALYNYFISKMGMTPYRRGWLKGNCPECGAEFKYGVNIGNNHTNCFKCGYNEKPIDVVMNVEKIHTLRDLLKILNDSDTDFKYVEPRLEPLEEKPVSYPAGFNLITDGGGLKANMARKYMSNRGFDLKELMYKGVGYCSSGKLDGYIILPFMEGGKLVYYHTRKFFGNGPKYNNPPLDEFGIGKNHLIYNIEALFIHNRVMLFEGVLNAETIGDKAIATGGKHLSSWQKSQIINSPAEMIDICLDDDAYDKAILLALELVHFKKVKVVLFPKGKDANDLGRINTLRLTHKFRYLNYSQLIKLKNDQRSKYKNKSK